MKNIYNEVVTVTEMKEAERYTYNHFGISSLDFMERAGNKIYRFLHDKRLVNRKDCILIICGCGNNGGDGLVLAQHLIKNGYSVKVLVLGDSNNMSESAGESLKCLLSITADIEDVNANNLKKAQAAIQESRFIVDAIFGIGLNRNIEGLYYDIIMAVNNSSATVFSIDIPSGINGNNGIVMGVAVKANYTLIIQNYKTGNLLNDSCDYQGTPIVLNIGIRRPPQQPTRYLLTSYHLAGIIKPRLKNTHKYNYGKGVIFGGSAGMTGAPLLAALALLRSGAGISVLAINHKYRRYFANYNPEIMVNAYRSKAIKNITVNAQAVAFGMGLGKTDNINYRYLKQLLSLSIPLVIDADGLYYFKKYLALADEKVILTPHSGELANLVDLSVSEINNDPLGIVERLVEKYRFQVVLKGPTTIIANKDAIYFHRRPNPGMATAGSGDVLAGIITGFLAQDYSITEACKLGVVFHSLAGYAARKIYGEHGMIASDIINCLPNEILKISIKG
ncbi:MAG: NAD(P)H-hydrate dehydratase [Bacilli bacterium]|nr:NAD(P)H-hydrate dehydratase [Bacilli bacterium]MDD4077944.1 NAD(P)H-hydrate dehydratase [Bacilli bacterium]MDD4388231.1 NAD(P)H-hydrate dehydratase [Bacilli bacterium]